MTFREKLGDLISGGALSRARGECAVVTTDGVSFVTRDSVAADNVKLFAALAEIRDTTATGKSGTAMRVHRIAKEALE